VVLVLLVLVAAWAERENWILDGRLLESSDAQGLLIMNEFHVGNLSRWAESAIMKIKLFEVHRIPCFVVPISPLLYILTEMVAIYVETDAGVILTRESSPINTNRDPLSGLVVNILTRSISPVTTMVCGQVVGHDI
jgi:hypothetical protein